MNITPRIWLSLWLPWTCLLVVSCKVCEERWNQDKVPPTIQVTELVHDRTNPENPEVEELLDAGLRDLPSCINTFDEASLDLRVFTNKPTCNTEADIVNRPSAGGFSVGAFVLYDPEWTDYILYDPVAPCPGVINARSCWSFNNRTGTDPALQNTDLQIHIYSRFNMPEALEFGSPISADDFGPPAEGEPPPIILVRIFDMHADDTPFPQVQRDDQGNRRCADIFLGYFEKP